MHEMVVWGVVTLKYQSMGDLPRPVFFLLLGASCKVVSLPTPHSPVHLYLISSSCPFLQKLELEDFYPVDKKQLEVTWNHSCLASTKCGQIQILFSQLLEGREEPYRVEGWRERYSSILRGFGDFTTFLFPWQNCIPLNRLHAVLTLKLSTLTAH